jgi:zinc transport system substrate-binding protein
MNLAMSSLSRTLLVALLCALGPLPAATAGQRPLVVATIRPLALIAQDVLGERAEVRQLLPDNTSPHSHALRISERRLLAEAGLVLRVGPELETFLVDALRGVEPARLLTAAELAGIHWPGAPDGRPREGRDQHLWLDPRNAVVIARALVARLTAAGAVDAATVVSLAAFETRLAELAAELEAALAPVRSRPFAGDHDAFGHFAARFGLVPAGYLNDAAGHAVGARSGAELLARDDIHCLVAEPGARLAQLRNIAARWDARLVVIDPLGGAVPGGDGRGYERLLRSIAESFAEFLAGRPVR